MKKDTYRTTLFEALLTAKDSYGKRMPVIEDVEHKPLDYSRLILAALILGNKFTASTKSGEPVGVLLPNINAVAVTIFGLSAYGRIPALLNFSAGLWNIKSACQAAQINTIVSSRRFVKKAELDDLIEGLNKHKIQILWLEDLRKQISFLDKLTGLYRSKRARYFYQKFRLTPDDTGAILFTSGSEGTPKGVVLSHANLMSNVHQIYSATEFTPDDRFFNPLPVFHCFGLTAGMLTPILMGMHCFLYPSPLHYKIIPNLIKKVRSTVLFGTDTFLGGYARTAKSGDFETLRLVIGGAERMKERTRKAWQEGFDLDILEGYGATEASPVIAVNTPKNHKNGTVGPFVKDIEYRLEPVPGLDVGSCLHVKGPNIMAGYLRAEKPGVLEPPEDGWHDLGDIVTVDDDGFITILGRAKRFANISGELVSLAAVEAFAATIWPDHAHAVTSVEDTRKGEQLVLVTDCADADRTQLVKNAKEHGIAELMIPKKVVLTEVLPMLGTGKIDYEAITELAQS